MRTDTLLKCDADAKDAGDAKDAAAIFVGLGLGRGPDCRREGFIYPQGGKKSQKRKEKRGWRGQIRVRVSERLGVRSGWQNSLTSHGVYLWRLSFV